MKKPIKAYMLPTEDKSHLIKFQGKLTYGTNSIWNDDRVGYFTQHLYITSDEEIKESDWCYSLELNEVFQATKPSTAEGRKTINNSVNTFLFNDDCRKIIATSDKSLLTEHDDTVPFPKMKDTGIHEVSLSFLDAFVESGGRKDGWEIEYEQYGLCVPCNEQGARHCAHPEECGYSQVLDRLKLDSDNCVNITPTCHHIKKEGSSCSLNNNCTYPDCRECEHPFNRLQWVGTQVFCNKCKTTLVKQSTEITSYIIINDFINSIPSKIYSRIRGSKGDAECRRYLREHKNR